MWLGQTRWRSQSATSLQPRQQHLDDTGQLDEESKLRKLQTYVEIVVGARTGFRVADTSRARRVVPVRQPDVDNEASKPSSES